MVKVDAIFRQTENLSGALGERIAAFGSRSRNPSCTIVQFRWRSYEPAKPPGSAGFWGHQTTFTA